MDTSRLRDRPTALFYLVFLKRWLCLTGKLFGILLPHFDCLEGHDLHEAKAASGWIASHQHDYEAGAQTTHDRIVRLESFWL